MKVTVLHTEIVLVDVVGFSGLPDEAQWISVQMMSSVLQAEVQLLQSNLSPPADGSAQNHNVILAFIPTGDGFYSVLHPAVFGYGVLFALGVRGLLLNRVQDAAGLFTDVRVAVHAGTAIPFRDVTDRLNFVGEGLNTCARLLSLRDDNLARAIEFAGGNRSYAVASITALSQFHRRYRTDTPDGLAFLRQSRFRQSSEQVHVDHGSSHRFHSIETDGRLVYTAPSFSPLDRGDIATVDEELRRIMEAETDADVMAGET